MAKNTRQRILDSALALFGRHGVSGVSLEMVAAEVALTRQAIYRYFKDRDSLFVEAVQSLHAQALEAAEVAALAATKAGRPLDVTLADVLEARFAPFVERLEQSGHADELLAENARLVGEVASDYQERLVSLVARLIVLHRQSTGAQLRHGLTDDDLAHYLIQAVLGVKAATSPRQPAAFRRKMRIMVAIVTRGGLADP
ncbi:TetR/AcrR family transcriptional regulator [Zavarzinia sp.]|uniref:TetR/AcrR family transcriptional regulator n=1 Tax=Zavarzinia sp. TaxID=2027920 RepID=UPI003563BC2E